jgi:hypothetical protein
MRLYFLRADLRLEDFLPEDLRVDDLRVEDLRVEDLRVEDFLPLDFLPEVFLPLDDFRDDDLRGTLAPFSRASDKPIAIACFRLLTLRPLPERSVPFFFRRIADSTRLLAAFPYFLPPDDFRAAIVTNSPEWRGVCGSGRDTPGKCQAVVEVVETCISPDEQTFCDSYSRIRKRVNLRRNYMIQPSFSVSDVDDRVSTVIHNGFFLKTNTQRAMHDASATLRREKFNGAEGALSAKCIASRNAAPEHHVHT